MKKGFFVVLCLALIVVSCCVSAQSKHDQYLHLLKTAYTHNKKIPEKKLKDIREFIRENNDAKGPVIPAAAVAKNISECNDLGAVYYAYLVKREMYRSIDVWGTGQ